VAPLRGGPAHPHRLPVPGWPCSPRSRTERRGGQPSNGAQNRRSVSRSVRGSFIRHVHRQAAVSEDPSALRSSGGLGGCGAAPACRRSGSPTGVQLCCNRLACWTDRILSSRPRVEHGCTLLWDDDYPFGASPAEVDAGVARVERIWGTPEAALHSYPSTADDEAFGGSGTTSAYVPFRSRGRAATSVVLARRYVPRPD